MRCVYRVQLLYGYFLLSDESCVFDSCVLSAVGSSGPTWKSQVQHKSPFVGGCRYARADFSLVSSDCLVAGAACQTEGLESLALK